MSVQPEAADAELQTSVPADKPRELPFPPVSKNHILNCSFHSWHPKYAPSPRMTWLYTA